MKISIEMIFYFGNEIYKFHELPHVSRLASSVSCFFLTTRLTSDVVLKISNSSFSSTSYKHLKNPNDHCLFQSHQNCDTFNNEKILRFTTESLINVNNGILYR